MSSLPLVVYDTMGYIQTVNKAANNSMLQKVHEVQNTTTYLEKHGTVSVSMSQHCIVVKC